MLVLPEQDSVPDAANLRPGGSVDELLSLVLAQRAIYLTVGIVEIPQIT
jgi:hypothetical protein